ALSQDPEALTQIMRFFHLHNLWFLDSRTSPDTQICHVARREGVFCKERDLFLDDPPDPATMGKRLKKVSALAQKRGWAIALGHPKVFTSRTLEAFLNDMPRISIVRLSRLY
ncbi:MAG: divergent polysaccharide deacetylase family protein, partial [Pseudomonadota bacterium]